MQVALTLQYIPPDGSSAPVTACTTTDPRILRQYRRAVLRAWAKRVQVSAQDETVARLVRADAARVREVLDLLLPEESGR